MRHIARLLEHRIPALAARPVECSQLVFSSLLTAGGLRRGVGVTGAVDGTDQSYWQTAYQVQKYLGDGYFYFNCHSGLKTASSPTEWGSCPGVDA